MRGILNRLVGKGRSTTVEFSPTLGTIFRACSQDARWLPCLVSLLLVLCIVVQQHDDALAATDLRLEEQNFVLQPGAISRLQGQWPRNDGGLQDVPACWLASMDRCCCVTGTDARKSGAQRTRIVLLQDRSSFLIRQSSFVGHHSSFISHHPSFINHHPLAIIRQSSFSFITHHSSSINRHSSSIIHHPSSIIHHSAVIIHQSSFIRHHPSVIIHLSSVIIHPSSVICHHSFVICMPSFIIHHASFLSHHPSSILHQ